jgi:hypothetical protein
MPTSKRRLERQSYGWSRMSETVSMHTEAGCLVVAVAGAVPPSKEGRRYSAAPQG